MILMPEPVVSVQMITYNQARFITQAVEGVLQQKTTFPIEVVIGEDCSIDGTREIVLAFKEKYPDMIRVITSETNVGMKENTLRTIRACRGKYIAFCEGDDYWHRMDKLQKQVDYLEAHPECGMVFADCHVYHDKSGNLRTNVRYSEGYCSPAKIDVKQILGGGNLYRWAWTLTAMVRRDLCHRIIESDPYLHQSEELLMGDTQLFAELALISQVSYMPESFATYRVLDESASRSKDPKKVLHFWKSEAEMKLYLCNKHKLPEDIRMKAESDWCDKSLRLALYARDPELAMEVKSRRQTFTWEEWLRYYGAKYLAIYYVYRCFALFSNLFRKRYDQYK